MQKPRLVRARWIICSGESITAFIADGFSVANCPRESREDSIYRRRAVAIRRPVEFAGCACRLRQRTSIYSCVLGLRESRPVHLGRDIQSFSSGMARSSHQNLSSKKTTHEL